MKKYDFDKELNKQDKHIKYIKQKYKNHKFSEEELIKIGVLKWKKET